MEYRRTGKHSRCARRLIFFFYVAMDLQTLKFEFHLNVLNARRFDTYVRVEDVSYTFCFYEINRIQIM